jgi:hypothetical protein
MDHIRFQWDLVEQEQRRIQRRVKLEEIQYFPVQELRPSLRLVEVVVVMAMQLVVTCTSVKMVDVVVEEVIHNITDLMLVVPDRRDLVEPMVSRIKFFLTLAVVAVLQVLRRVPQLVDWR